jgi:hypothetical protein
VSEWQAATVSLTRPRNSTEQVLTYKAEETQFLNAVVAVILSLVVQFDHSLTLAHSLIILLRTHLSLSLINQSLLPPTHESPCTHPRASPEPLRLHE